MSEFETETEPHKPRWGRRIILILLAMIFIVIFLIVALRVFIRTAPGARFIESQINGRTIGPIKSVQISGLSGDPLSELTLENIELSDKNGVWLKARDVDLDWSPLAAMKRHLEINDLNVATVDVLRRPELEPTTESRFDEITLPEFELGDLTLREAVAGQTASFSVLGAAAIAGPVLEARLNAKRTDNLGDIFDLDFKKSADGNLSGEFEISGAANGSIAQIIRAPENTDVRGSGTLTGTPQSGRGNFAINFGEEDVANGTANWTAELANLEAQINTRQWTVFDSLSASIGQDISIDGSIERTAKNAPFTLDVDASNIDLNIRGALPDEGFVPETARIDAETANVSSLIELPAGYSAGNTVVTGEVSTASGYAFKGQAAAQSVVTPYGKADAISGPLAIAQVGDQIFAYDADLKFAGLSLTQEVPVELGRNAQVTAKGRADLGQRLVAFESAKLVSGPTTATANGQVGWAELSYKASGTAKTQLRSIGTLPAGAIESEFDVEKTAAKAPALIAAGRFMPSDPFAEPLGGLIGPQLNFQTRVAPVDNGIEIFDTRISGENVRAAVEGRVTDQYDVSGEAVLGAAVTYNNVVLGENSEASFELSGLRTAPDLRVDARSSEASFNGVTLTTPRLRAEMQDILNAPKGPVQLEAGTEYGDLSFAAQFASSPGVYAAEDIAVTLGELSASGSLSLPESRLVTGVLKLNLPEGEDNYARASLSLAPRGDEQGLSLEVDAKNIALADFEFDVIKVAAEGTLEQLTGEIETKGRRNLSFLSRNIELAAPISLARTAGQTAETAYQLQVSPTGQYGNISLSARSPINLNYEDGALRVEAPLSVSEQPVDLNYTRESGSENFSLKADNLPITLIPMPGNLADTRGQVAVDVNLSSSAGGITGRGVATLSDWRGFDIKKGEGISADAEVTLDGRQANLTIKGNSEDGFGMNGSSRIGLNGATSLAGLRLDNAAPFSGDFQLSGSAESIFGLITDSDADLGGTLDASLSLSGTATAPLIDGQASGKDIKFEFPELGTQVREGRFSANFQNDRLSVTDVYVSDTDKGYMQGQGEFMLGELGRLIGSLDIEAKNFRGLDRKDLESRFSGKLAYISTAEDAELSGDIRLNDVELRQFIEGAVAVIEVDVEEINRPDDVAVKLSRQANIPIKLNINVTAPRQVYIRSRGLDVEMSVDVKITGTPEEPILKGEALVVRGGYRLGGKQLDISEGSIKFNGPLATAVVSLTAAAETTDINAEVEVTGTVEEPEITLTSTPERPQDEVLSALLFGRSATELSTIEAAQLAGALAQFSGSGGGLDLLGGLRDALGVGQISVGFSEDGTAQIQGGRYLAKNVYLRVFSGARSDQTGAIIDWEIRKNISLQSKLQADSDQTFSLTYKRDF